MIASALFRSIAGLVGEPVRASILWSLMDGRALTATELAMRVSVSPQSASMHLGKLVEAELLTVERQGNHRYFRFARPEVADLVDAMANLMPAERIKQWDEEVGTLTRVKNCRTCYDHLAGRVSVALADRLVQQKILSKRNNQFNVTPKGAQWFSDFGIDLDEVKQERRIFAKSCLDWSERRSHVAGALGAAIRQHLLSMGWLRQRKDSREVIITAKGQAEFYRVFRLAT